MTTKRTVLYLALAGILAAGFAAPAAAQDTIKIGELNSYKAFPAFLDPYKKGMELAVEEINAKGGVLGKKLEVISRDDGANPGEAVRVAEELVTREKVAMLAGTFLSNIGLAVTNFAGQKKVVFLAAEPLTDKITWADGNKYTFRLRASTYMQVAMLMPDAVAAHKKRWALVYPNFEYGQSAAANFKALMKKAQPDVEFVTEQATPLGQDRRRRGGAGHRRRQAGRHLQRAVRRRPRQVRARRQHPRRVQEPHGGQPVVGRAGISRSAQGRGAGRLDRHRLSVEQDQDPGALRLRQCLSHEVQNLSAARLGGRLRDHQVGGGGADGGQVDRPGKAGGGVQGAACRQPLRRVLLPGESTIRRPWAALSARSRWRTARAP